MLIDTLKDSIYYMQKPMHRDTMGGYILEDSSRIKMQGYISEDAFNITKDGDKKDEDITYTVYITADSFSSVGIPFDSVLCDKSYNKYYKTTGEPKKAVIGGLQEIYIIPAKKWRKETVR